MIKTGVKKRTNARNNENDENAVSCSRKQSTTSLGPSFSRLLQKGGGSHSQGALLRRVYSCCCGRKHQLVVLRRASTPTSKSSHSKLLQTAVTYFYIGILPHQNTPSPRGHVKATVLERLDLPPHLLRVVHVLHSMFHSHRLSYRGRQHNTNMPNAGWTGWVQEGC